MQPPPQPQHARVPRSSKAENEKPYIWIPIGAIQSILGNVENETHAIAVLVALILIANEKGRGRKERLPGPTFQAYRSTITQRCGLGKTAVDLTLKDLERIGLVQIDRPHRDRSSHDAPNTFTLLSVNPSRHTGDPITPNVTGGVTHYGTPSPVMGTSKNRRFLKNRKDEKPDPAQSGGHGFSGDSKECALKESETGPLEAACSDSRALDWDAMRHCT